jgi:hypothetical protein
MLAIAIALLAQAAAPPPPPPLPSLHYGSSEIACPVGGQRFKTQMATMFSIMGRRPDEKPYSELSFPLPVRECPDNGLVIFADFTPAETAALAKWVATPVYQAMRKSESPFYRSYWLAIICKREPRADAFDRASCARPDIAAIVGQLH